MSMSIKSRPIVMGESNPHGAVADFALYPDPPGCAGHRLCVHLGLTPDAYLEAFERRNLLVLGRMGTWSVRDARESARAFLSGLRDGVRIVLLGARVAAAFGLPYRPPASYQVALPLAPERGGVFRHCGGTGCSDDDACRCVCQLCARAVCAPRASVLVVPHPSGRNLAWNNRGMAHQCARAILEIAGLAADPCRCGACCLKRASNVQEWR